MSTNDELRNETDNGTKPVLGGVSGGFLSTPKHYQKYMFMYGILSVLFVLEYYEYEEEYEECQKIIDAIKDQEKALETTLFTTITTEAIKEVIETYKKFNLTGKNEIENSKYYSTLILKEIESDLRVY